MPIDLTRIPPKVAIPPPPRLSRPAWAALFAVAMSSGAALTVSLWPAGRPTNTVWFWLYVLGYPALAWAFLLCCRLAYRYAARSSATAANYVSEQEEEKCHALASQPLAVIGQAWLFSGDPNENQLDALIDGQVWMHPRQSRADPSADVNARWLEIPGKPLYAGNALTEYARHRVICKWLLHGLVDQLAPRLQTIPSNTALHVELSLQSALKPADVRDALQQQLAERFPALRISVQADGTPISLFRVDAWLDHATPSDAYLLVAIQLRKAVSQLLQDGVAEAGVALLVGAPAIVERMSSHLTAPALHRPAEGALDEANPILELAARWSQTSTADIRSVWTHALSPEGVRAARSSTQLAELDAQWIDLESTVGDCGWAGAWLAAALSAEHAVRTGEPQLAITQEGGRLIALVCNPRS